MQQLLGPFQIHRFFSLQASRWGQIQQASKPLRGLSLNNAGKARKYSVVR